MRNLNPILVTGAHRTGTTWVGRVLGASPVLSYLGEPLHVNHSRGVLDASVDHWYTYITPENEDPYREAYIHTLSFQYRFPPAIKQTRTWKDAAKMARDVIHFFRAKLWDQRPLLKDPFAVFSVPWFKHEFGAQVVVTVRHPLGFVSSLKRLDWTFDFRNLLDQSLLMRDHLEEYRSELRESLSNPEDVIGQGILLWKVIYSVVAKFQEEDEDLIVVRHEDLSLGPMQEFRDLCDLLELSFSNEIQRKVEETTGTKNPQQLPPGDEHAVQLDSKANLNNWKQRLTTSEVDRIVSATTNELFGFYEREEWRAW